MNRIINIVLGLIGHFVICEEVEIGVDQYPHENFIFGVFPPLCL